MNLHPSQSGSVTQVQLAGVSPSPKTRDLAIPKVLPSSANTLDRGQHELDTQAGSASVNPLTPGHPNGAPHNWLARVSSPKTMVQAQPKRVSSSANPLHRDHCRTAAQCWYVSVHLPRGLSRRDTHSTTAAGDIL